MENKMETKRKTKTGGMVNANSKVSKQTVPGSKGVKSGVNPKAAASKVARGRVGGTSSAPKTALPKAQMGGSTAYEITKKARAKKAAGDKSGYYETLKQKGSLSAPMSKAYEKLKSKKAMPKAQMGTQVVKKDYMKPVPIDSTLTRKDIKRIIKQISKKKKN